jgi:hypothetical protein
MQRDFGTISVPLIALAPGAVAAKNGTSAMDHFRGSPLVRCERPLCAKLGHRNRASAARGTERLKEMLLENLGAVLDRLSAFHDRVFRQANQRCGSHSPIRDCNPSEGESGLPPSESRVGVQNDTDSFPGMFSNERRCRVGLGRGRKGIWLCRTELSFVLPQLQF